jgi:hypothetical protein
LDPEATWELQRAFNTQSTLRTISHLRNGLTERAKGRIDNCSTVKYLVLLSTPYPANLVSLLLSLASIVAVQSWEHLSTAFVKQAPVHFCNSSRVLTDIEGNSKSLATITSSEKIASRVSSVDPLPFIHSFIHSAIHSFDYRGSCYFGAITRRWSQATTNIPSNLHTHIP